MGSILVFASCRAVVERNPALLLSSGVGYTTNRKKKTSPRRNINSRQYDNDRDSDSIHSNDDTNMINTRVDQDVEEMLLKRTWLSSSAMERMKGSAPFVLSLDKNLRKSNRY